MNFEAGSFRDRSSRVFYDKGEVYRTLDSESQSIWHKLKSQSFFQQMTDAGQIISTRELSNEECQLLEMPAGVAGVLHHERVPFISYPYEWSFSMLRSAALLHLQILTESLKHGLILKDATPYNVQFFGSKPVFIDLGSFIGHQSGEPWVAYRQFCELMLFPLMLQAYRGVHFHLLLRSQLEGIGSKQFLQWMRWRDMFRPGVFTNGWVQSKLESQTQALSTSTVRDLRSSGFQTSMIERMFAKLTRLVEQLKWSPQHTQWQTYDNSLPHVAEDGNAKAEFVRKVSRLKQRRLVWDLGCNDGRYSKVASEWAATVVAMDQDHACIDRLFQSLGPDQTKILPICVDLANPSPALGWRGRERKTLELRGRPDLVICLGLIHHLVIAANVPLADVVDWLQSLGGEVILEFPSKKDAMVRSLLRNKRDQYDDYSLENLESELAKYFDLVDRESLPSGERTLIHAVPRKSVELKS